MIESLSILIPTYNYACVELVKALHKQASAIEGLSYFEIFVVDDGSTDKQSIKQNMEIRSIRHCRYRLRANNKGRASTRNELARDSKGEWLLFIDSDMVIRNGDYLRSYVEMSEADVTYGGYDINGDKALLKGNLRYKYESEYEGNRSASKRREHPYEDFHTSNFLVRRAIMTAYPLDERFVGYGYEDVIWGKTLKKAGINIRHIDNPVSFEIFERNIEFLLKTIEGVTTLVKFSDELRGYSRILSISERLRKWHLAKPFSRIFRIVEEPIKYNLIGNKPRIFLFNIYKVGIYLMFTEE